MDLADFVQLLTDEGQAALSRAAELAAHGEPLVRQVERLGREFRSDLARWAVTMSQLRVAARSKFRQADVMYFTREALEQATGDLVAEYRARRFRGFSRVGDLCCGIGGDTLALARQANVVAVDLDPLRLAMARANVAAVQPHAAVAFEMADAARYHRTDLQAIFIDPDRRTDTGRRFVRLEDYFPPVSRIIDRWNGLAAWAMKVSPAVPWDDLQPLDAEIEFISVGGELKECVLWFHGFREARRRATVLPEAVSLAADAPAERSIGPVGLFLHDPDPAVTRAGLVTHLAPRLNAHLIDPHSAFLSGDQPSASPFAQTYQVEAVLPFGAKPLRNYLREHRVGSVTWVKRGHAADVDALARQMKLHGEEHRSVILTRISDRPQAIVARPISRKQ